MVGEELREVGLRVRQGHRDVGGRGHNQLEVLESMQVELQR